MLISGNLNFQWTHTVKKDVKVSKTGDVLTA